MQEGLANICLVTSSMTIVRAKIEVAIPRKRKGHAQQHEKVDNSTEWSVGKLLIGLFLCIGFAEIFRQRHAVNFAPRELWGGEMRAHC